MKIVFLVNSVQEEDPKYSTPLLMKTATDRGHEAYVTDINSIEYTKKGLFKALCKKPVKGKYKTSEEYFIALQDANDNRENVKGNEMDVLFLRHNPADDLGVRPWAVTSPIMFAQLAERNGVLVLNDPRSLHDAGNKMYFQYFPKEVRIPTIITRNPKSIRKFYEKHNKQMVLKPLQGSGGTGVFFINKKNEQNLNQTIEMLCKEGFIIVQEFVKAASESDVRLFMMNGEPLQMDGKYAALMRKSAKNDIRSNLHAGATIAKAEVTEDILKLANMVSPKLKRDGMFLVGLDISDQKIIEINVFSPGGLNTMKKKMGNDFCPSIIESIEEKVYYKKLYGNRIPNYRLAVL